MLVVIAAIVACALSGALSARAQTDQKTDDQLSLAIVQAVCPKQVRTETLKSGAVEYGCGGCPAFTSFHSDAPSKDNEPNFELRNVLTGSFTHADAKEIAAEFYGCEPHVYNFGGVLLLDNSGAQLKRIRWVRGPIGMVRTYPMAQGRDLVLSQGGYMGQGLATNWVSTLDFVKQDPMEQTLLSIDDDTLAFCESDVVTVGSVDKLEFPYLNGDGRPDLRVIVRSGKVKLPPNHSKPCDADFKPPAVPSYTVEFVFTRKSFQVTPATAGALRRVNAHRE